MTDQDNPLLQDFDLPSYSAIRPEHIEPAIDTILADSRAAIEQLLSTAPQPTWDSLVLPMDELGARLGEAWSPVSHLNAVCNSPELRTAYEACLPKLSEFWTEQGQNRALFDAYQALANSPAAEQFSIAQKTILEDELRDFRLSGIDLEPAKQKRYGEIQMRLSDLSSSFSNNLLDATQAWTKHITDEQALAGLTDSAKEQMAQAAQAKELDGWLITLEFPSYYAIMTYADDRNLREEVYSAYSTRASDQGPNAGQLDNTPVMEEILDLRLELAQLLSFKNYSELSLSTKMADSTEQVFSFLHDLAERSKPSAEQDLTELRAFAAEHNVSDLNSWDIGYFSEKLREQRYDISEEELRTYFPIDKVLSGLFAIVEQLYGIQITELSDFDSWHPDVRLFEITEDGKHVGRFFFDLYARSHKRGGAWMDGSRDKYRASNGSLINPIAYLVCNFTPAGQGKPALLTHDEVTTLFHEFGHGLHHLLTMLAARNFQSGLGMLRQIEFSLFDFELHCSHGDGRSVLDVLQTVRDQVAVMVPPSWNRFANSFAHIFAGGYAAGYYSYKWAEVLSADAFSRFEEEGVLNPVTGRAFRDAILAKGGSQSPMQLFIEFRGRKPSIDALLRHSGLSDHNAA